MNIRVCSVNQCSAPSIALGLCWKHYRRQYRHGNVQHTKRRYKMPHECQGCGITQPEAFYAFYKSICKQCRKLRTIQHGLNSSSKNSTVIKRTTITK